MNVLSFAERQAMVEDIHGVLDVIEETTELVAQSIEEMKQVLGRMNSQQREAWDRAVFLRPALADDQRFHLIFLRARRFQAYEATVLMVSYMRVKRDLWGDDLLIHRITWDDVSVLICSSSEYDVETIVPSEEGRRYFRNHSDADLFPFFSYQRRERRYSGMGRIGSLKVVTDQDEVS